MSISQPSNSLGSFQFDGTLSTARRGLAAALLTPDSILVTGGWDGAVSGTALKTAEIYNIPQQTSTQAHSMTTGRAGHSLVQLPSSSQFLVIGERTNITGSPKFAKALKALQPSVQVEMVADLAAEAPRLARLLREGSLVELGGPGPIAVFGQCQSQAAKEDGILLSFGGGNQTLLLIGIILLN